MGTQGGTGGVADSGESLGAGEGHPSDHEARGFCLYGDHGDVGGDDVVEFRGQCGPVRLGRCAL